MSNDIQPTHKHLSIDWVENNGQTEPIKQGSFLGRTVVQISPKEREINRAHSKLELSETLSMLANTELTNSILSFDKETNAAEGLLNRKVQELTPGKETN